MKKTLPHSQLEYLVDRLQSLPAGTRVVLVFDPDGATREHAKLVDPAGKEWTILPLWRNLLEVSLFFQQRVKDQPVLVCVRPPARPEHRLNLAYVPQIASSMEAVIDLSLSCIIRYYEPDVALPSGALARYAALLRARLDRAVQAFRQIRQARHGSIPGEAEVQLMALACAVPDMPLKSLLGREVSTFSEALKLLFREDLNDEARGVLCSYLLSRVPGSVRPWIEADATEASLVLYAAWVLRALRQPLGEFNLRGIGVAAGSLDRLCPELGGVSDDVWCDRDLMDRIAAVAEREIGQLLLKRLQDEAVRSAVPRHRLAADLPPRVAQGVLRQQLMQALKAESTPPWLVDWGENRHPSPVSATPDPVPEAISVLASILRRLAEKAGDMTEPGSLVDWYVSSGTATLEFDLWKAEHLIKETQDRELLAAWAEARGNLRQRMRSRLLEADLALAKLAGGNRFVQHPRLVCNVLKSMVLDKSLAPPQVARVWIIVLDGMRWDLWQEAVRPALESVFEVAGTTPFLSMLPSTTGVSRTSLIAGRAPDEWQSSGRFTDSEEALGARAFGLNDARRRTQYSYLSNMGGRFSQMELAGFPEKKSFNVVIYNLADDWLHRQENDPYLVGQTVNQMFHKSILPDLRLLIDEGDAVLVSSDHGFLELDPADEAPAPVTGIEAGIASEVSYRYARGTKPAAPSIEVTYKGLGTYFAATGHTWFRYPNGKYTRYSHGGVSLSEMVVPAAILRKKRIRKTVLNWEAMPARVEALEDEPVTVELCLKCAGNEQVSYSLRAETGSLSPAEGALAPGEYILIRLEVAKNAHAGTIRLRGTGKSVSGETVKIDEASLTLVRRERIDKVEFDQGALDLLEKTE
ncbi:MAG: PglZ domain-containing protein [Chloroflexi bacterium]|nr:PglZ domain-containing protein [Chloroflexota bacterium]